MPYVGNAAANTVDYLDLDGANKAPRPLPPGFTPRGIVAMAFSIVSALLGLVAIVWYGMQDMGTASKALEERRTAAIDASNPVEIAEGATGRET